MGRCNPVTKTCTRTPWWRSAMGIDWIGSSGQGGGSGGGGAVPLIAMDLTSRTVYVPAGTNFEDINFSDYYYNEIKAIGDDSEIVTCEIEWAEGSYDTTAGTYNLTGTLVPPSGYDNSNSLVPEITIDVVTLAAGFSTILGRYTSAGYTLPSPINQGDLNNLYVAIATPLATMDGFYCMLDDSPSNTGLINWAAANVATITGTVTKVSRKGFQGDGATGFVNPGLVLSGLTNYTLNSAGSGCYVYQEPTKGNIAGCVANGARLSLQCISGSRANTYEINGNTNPSISDSYVSGLYHVYRTTSGLVGLAKNNGAIATSISDTSIARPSVTPYILARNNGGTADFFSDGIISMWWVGANHSSNIGVIAAAWRTYLIRARLKNTYSAPVAIGEKVNDDFARAALGASYTVSGGTFSCDGSKLVTSGGAPTTYTNRCLYEYGHSSENCRIDLNCQLGSTPSGSTGGIGIGFSDFSGANGERTVFAVLDMTTGADAGKVRLVTWNGTTASTQATASTAIPTLASGDSFTLVLTKAIVSGLVKYEITATRVSDSASTTATYSALLGDSTGDFAMFQFGGTVNVSLFKATINDQKYKKVCFVGDSLTHGYAASSLDDRYASNVVTSFEVSAGSGDLTADVVGGTNLPGKIRNLLDYEAEYYAINLGGNDAGSGVSSSIWQNNLRCLIDTIRNDGRKVILIYPFPRSGADMSATIGAFFESLYPSEIIIDEGYTATKASIGSGLDPLYDDGDNVHMNTLGHQVGAAAIQGALPILY